MAELIPSRIWRTENLKCESQSKLLLHVWWRVPDIPYTFTANVMRSLLMLLPANHTHRCILVSLNQTVLVASRHADCTKQLAFV